MTILEKGCYRLQTISVLNEKGFEEMPISYGLGIEKKYNDSYYVVCFVKFNEKENFSEVESIGTRLLDVEDDEWALFKDMLASAITLVNTANRSVE